MVEAKAHIIARLQKEILSLQGFKSIGSDGVSAGLGVIKYAFPNAVFPLAAVHEFFCTNPETASASYGFIAGILSAMSKSGGALIWIGSSRILFPPALKAFGIDPEKVVFIEVRNAKHRLWALEEALKCEGLCAVVGEVQEFSFTESRRFQLAVERSRVTGFVIRNNPKNLATTCVTRWRISPIAGEVQSGLPGVGFARWNVELIKVRNGKPGNWQLTWADGKFKHLHPLAAIVREEHRKTG